MSGHESGSRWGIWGNAVAVDQVSRAVRRGPRHAYIFSGVPSIGKSTLAASFAAALVCPNPEPDGSACDACSTCRRVAKGVHSDVASFDLAHQGARDDTTSKNTSINIATVREISRHVALKPVESRWRVVIVDDVETMLEPAQEAFLKTLEEPPSYVVIVLLTNDAELLLPTIISRCSQVTMSPVADSVVEEALAAHGANPEDARILAVASRGRVGVALSAMNDDQKTSSLLGTVSEATDWVSGDPYSRMVRSVRLADRFSESRDAVFEQLLAVQVAWRELLLGASDVASSSAHPVVSTCRLMTLQDGHRALSSIERCLRDLDANVRPRSALESMVLQWPTVGAGAAK